MTERVCMSRPSRVEQWIDAYWRTGALNLEPFDGCILKVAEGVGYLTEERKLWASTALKEAVNGGKRWQFYAFGRPDLRWGVEDGISEGEAMLEAIDELLEPHVVSYADGSHCAVWLDLEKDSDAPKADVLGFLMAYFETVDRRYPVGLYTSGDWLEDNVGLADETMASVFTRETDGTWRPLWTARYGLQVTSYPPGPDLVKYPVSVKAPNWYLLNRGAPPVQQWTSKRETPGIEAGHDSNLVYLAG